MMVGDKTRNLGEENAESGGGKRGIRGRKTRNPGEENAESGDDFPGGSKISGGDHPPF
jgi:hypothetical protein